MNTSKIYKVKGQVRFVQGIATYTNGIETTGGFYTEDQLEESNCPCITYDSEHYVELPLEWPDMEFIDDNNRRQKIREIRHDEEPAYVMADGSLSEEVTI